MKGRISALAPRSSADEGLVHQQQFGLGEQARGQWRRAGARRRRDGAASARAARARPSRSRTSSKATRERSRWLFLRRAEQQIFAHRKMWEKASLLEDIAQRRVCEVGTKVLSGVLPDLSDERRKTVREPVQPGDAAQDRGLAAARRPEQRGDALRRRAESGVEGECRRTRRESGPRIASSSVT